MIGYSIQLTYVIILSSLSSSTLPTSLRYLNLLVHISLPVFVLLILNLVYITEKLRDMCVTIAHCLKIAQQQFKQDVTGFSAIKSCFESKFCIYTRIYTHDKDRNGHSATIVTRLQNPRPGVIHSSLPRSHQLTASSR